MSKLRVGIIADQEYVLERGGESSYYHVLLNGINNFDFDNSIDIVNVVFCPKDCVLPNFKKPSIVIRRGKASTIKNIVKNKTASQSAQFFSRRNIVVKYLSDIVTARKKRKTEDILRANNIDLIYYLRPEMEVLNYPFIATHWDVGHKSMHAFPEVMLNGNYEKRENYYLQTLNKAFLILCESETGCEELEKYYSLYHDKLKVLPIFGGSIIETSISSALEKEILEHYQLTSENYFLYPAQFWAHKNHYNLIRAFHTHVTESNNTLLKLVLPGTDKGTMPYIKQVAEELGISGQVIIPGFVKSETLAVLYKNAIALIMPTFLGPTNLPLIEAAHLNCAVACSDLGGHREIMQEHAFYFEPANATSIKTSLEQMLDKKARDQLKFSAKQHITTSPFNLANSLNILNDMLVNCIPVRKTWGID